MATYTKKLVSGSLFVFSMSVLAAFIAYFTRIILARSLTPSEYGLFYAVFAFVSFFLFFRDLGLNQALARYIPEFRVKHKYNAIKTAIASVFLWQLLSSLVFGSLLFIFSSFLAKDYFKDASAALILKIFIIYILFSMLVMFLQSIFQGFQKIKLYSVGEPLRNILMLLLVILFLSLGLGVFAPVYAFALSWVLIFVLLVSFFARTFNVLRYKIKEFKNITRIMFAFGFPVMLTAIGAKLIARIDTLMLTYFTTLDQVGIYNVVLPTAMLFLFFSDSISAVAFPIISELWAKNDMEKLAEWLKLIYKYSFVFVAPALLAVFAFSDLFIRLFFGEAYVPGATALRILLIGALFFIMARFNHVTLSGIGKPAIVTKIILSAAAANFVLNLILIPLFGIGGAAAATAASYLLVLFLSVHATKKFIDVNVPAAAWLKTLASSLAFLFVIILLKNILAMNKWAELVISVAAAGIVYLILIYLLGLIDIGEIKKYVKLAR